ncbi:ATP-grasp ribosomal peptide maturase [Streptosporangium oxazolinicum]|uniref:ATP-grasp ribosomal peptide maturase n=1 Tax=Streptosporangium oxazolinicum TaxID=909287 RepID=A0ABP8B3L2_9ACTN
MILILTNRNDPSVDLVIPKLLQRGFEVYRWDPADYPASARFTSRLTGSSWRHTLVTPDAEIDSATVGSIWLRRPGEPQAASSVTDPAYRDFVTRTGQILMTGWQHTLDARWFPARAEALRLTQNKLVNLAAAVRVGFTVPQTTVTNDPGELAVAWERTDGQFIAKEVELVPYQVNGEDHAFYTTSVTRRHLTSRHRLAHSPMILQPRIDKAVELRVTVVGDQVFTAAITSGDSRTTRDDVRHQSSLTGYSAYELPARVAERCVKLVSSLGLAFGCIDVILTPDGEYVYLELNPAGQWAWVEELTGLPIAAAIADWLAVNEHPTTERARA